MPRHKRPPGIPIIGCRCSNPAWPLATVKASLLEDANSGRCWIPSWFLYREGGKIDDIRAQCPQCNRPFRAIFRNSYKDFYESAEDIFAAEDIPEGEIPEPDGDAFNVGYAQVSSYYQEVDYYPVVEILTPNAYVLPRSQRKKLYRPHHRQLFSREGMKTIYLDNEDKLEFVYKMWVLARKLKDPNNLRGWQHLPDWQADGTPQQFKAWTLELRILHYAKPIYLDFSPDAYNYKEYNEEDPFV